MREIRTEDAPTFDEYPFSQAIVHGDTVYLSGNVPLDPDTGEFVSGGMSEQARQVMRNIEAVLEAADTSLDNVVKATVFITDPEAFGEFNEVYREFVDEPYPARSAVVTDLVVDVDVEVEVVAAIE